MYQYSRQNYKMNHSECHDVMSIGKLIKYDVMCMTL